MKTKSKAKSPVTREALGKRILEIDRTLETESGILSWDMKNAFPALFKAASSVVSTNGSATAMKALIRVVEESRAINAKSKEIDRLYKERGQICSEIYAIRNET